MKLTYSEINDTFNALEKTRELIENTWGSIGPVLKGKKRYVFLGCGSSYSIAKSMSVMTYMATGYPSAAMAAGDVLLFPVSHYLCN